MTDRLSFSPKSRHLSAGLGPSERAIRDYTDLLKIRDWRRMLCDEYLCGFRVDRLLFPTVDDAVAGGVDRRTALLAKFRQTHLGATLLLTGDAELWRSGRGGAASVRDFLLEEIRSELRAAMR